ncbi:MAG: orotate phosphoribosyltransferase-like protein [Methanomicrobiales archaeon]|nr:orotate phosphoribosyltransferase-like protein [Methanomicrobiales archaeon]
MSSLEELMQRAKALHADGHGPSQIADELNLSMETVTWLLTREKGKAVPRDVLIDWSGVSSRAGLLEDLAVLMADRAMADGEEIPDIGVVVGIALSGVPLATLVALQADARLAVYHPARASQGEKKVGSVSGNFAEISGQRCLIVDDVITSGKTLREVVGYLRGHGATPVAIWVIFDKRGLREVEGVPVTSLFRVSRLD